MRVLRITPVPGTRLAENKDDARRLRKGALLPALAEGETVQLDFGEVEFATQSFVHALISEAIRLYREEAFNRIKFANCTDEIEQTVLTVFEYTFAAVEAAEVHSRSSPRKGYSAATVMKLVGITPRQLNYWARTGLVAPSIRARGGLGSQRLYSMLDVVYLRTIKRLLDAGVSLQRIRAAITYIRKESFGNSLADITLISDKERVYACHSDEEIIGVVSNGQAVIGISMRSVWADTEADLSSLPPRELVEGLDAAGDEDGSS